MEKQRVRSEKQILNDVACSVRLKAYHAELRRLKEAHKLADMNNSKPSKIKSRSKSSKLIENFESDSDITPLKNNPDEFDDNRLGFPVVVKRKYNKKTKFVNSDQLIV
jgi:hypothetical protein